VRGRVIKQRPYGMQNPIFSLWSMPICLRRVWRGTTRRIRPHIARVTDRHTPGLDGRTTRNVGYALSQRFRKKVEELFGWMKTIGGLRKTRVRGIARTQHYAHLVGTAYNLLRISRLTQQETGP
jgi:hypothetical protein